MPVKAQIPPRMTFAVAVRRVRTSRKLTQAELAVAAGLSRTQVSRIESGLAPGPLARQRLVGALRFRSLLELQAAAGDTEAIERLEGQKACAAYAKELPAVRAALSVAAGLPRRAAVADRARAARRSIETMRAPRWRVLS
jgi:transcriptional regulator with XRE-family HTH domain